MSSDAKAVTLKRLIELKEQETPEDAEGAIQEKTRVLEGMRADEMQHVRDMINGTTLCPTVKDLGGYDWIEEMRKSVAPTLALQEQVRELAKPMLAFDSLKNTFAITEQLEETMRDWSKPILAIDNLRTNLTGGVEWEKIAGISQHASDVEAMLHPTFSDPSPQFAPVIYPDAKLRVALDTQAAIEDLREATGQLVEHQATQIEHLKVANALLEVANARGEIALKEARADAKLARREAKVDREILRKRHFWTLAVAVVSVVIAAVSVITRQGTSSGGRSHLVNGVRTLREKEEANGISGKESATRTTIASDRH